MDNFSAAVQVEQPNFDNQRAFRCGIHTMQISPFGRFHSAPLETKSSLELFTLTHVLSSQERRKGASRSQWPASG